VDLGGGILTSAGGSDIFLVKYSAAGARLGGVGDESVRPIALGALGNICLGGYLTISGSWVEPTSPAS